MTLKKGSPPSIRARKKQGKERLAARLELPVLDAAKLARLRSPKRRQKTITELADELEGFRAVSDAVRRSDRYYFSALSKVYGVWMDLMEIDPKHRNELIVRLNQKNEEKTKRGDALHVLLRSLIDYRVLDVTEMSTDEARKARQAAWTRLSRDASVLRFAEREEIQVDDFVTFAKERPGGLEAMARAEASSKRASTVSDVSRQLTQKKVSTDAEAARSQPLGRAGLPKTASDRKPTWGLGSGLRKKLATGMFAGRELIFRVYVDENGRRTVRDVYQSSARLIEDGRWAGDMEGLGARLVGLGLKRPKV